MPRARRIYDLDEFEAAAAAFLATDPIRSTIPQVALSTARTRPPAEPLVLLLVEGTGSNGESKVQGVALRTPPWPVTLVLDPEARDRPSVATALARALAVHAADAPGFSGPTTDIAAVVPGWMAITGRPTTPHMEMLLHRLTDFAPVTGVPGRAEIADAGDDDLIDLLAQWRSDFSVAVHSPTPAPKDPHAVRRTLSGGATWMIWRDGRGRPVSTAVGSAAVSGCSRIAPVYTPPDFQRHGYGTAVTSALVGALQARGAAEVVLFTDVQNATANAIYRRLGFAPVEPFVQLTVD